MKAEPQVQASSISLNLHLIVCLFRPESNKPFFFPQSSLMVVVEVCPTVIIRTTKASPATASALVQEMSVRLATSNKGPRESLSHF